MKLSYAIDIHASPARVFSWLGTPERAMQWQTGVSRTEILQQTPGMVGTTFREWVEENGRGTELRGEVTDYRVNESLAIRLDGEYNTVRVSYRLAELAGGTRLTMRADVRFKSFLRVANLIFRPAFKKKLLAQFNEEYARLKGLCEQDEGG